MISYYYSYKHVDSKIDHPKTRRRPLPNPLNRAQLRLHLSKKKLPNPSPKIPSRPQQIIICDLDVHQNKPSLLVFIGLRQSQNIRATYQSTLRAKIKDLKYGA